MARSGVKSVALVTALLLALPVLAAAQGKRGQGEARWEGGQAGPFARLELTEEQQKRIDEIRDRDDQEKVLLQKEMMRARHDLHGILLEDTPDRAKVQKLVEKIGEIRTKLQVQHLDRWLAMREVLTQEQKDRLLLRGGPHLFDGPGRGWDRSGRGGHRGGWGEGPCPGDHGPRSMTRGEFGRPSWR